jgi:hypothetical protein
VLNEALRVHGGPAWHVFQVGTRRLLLSLSLVSPRDPCITVLTSFDL